METDDESRWWRDSLLNLCNRMERMSVDSSWAHRASGLRGSLLSALDQLEHQNSSISSVQRKHLQALLTRGYDLITLAAREIRGGNP